MFNKNKKRKFFTKFFTRGISLALAFIMAIPGGAFAGVHSGVKNWDEYRGKVKTDIMKQEKEITINFTGNSFPNTEYSARLIIEEEFKKGIKELPRYLGELNIKSEDTGHIINPNLKKVIHQIEYNIDKTGFTTLNKAIENEYINIKKKTTDYEKIKTTYDYIIDSLSDNEGKGVPEIKNVFLKEGEGVEEYKINAHTFLFAMMMTELGYDNDIATSIDLSKKWNLVKVQGEWYHVYIKNNRFLISKGKNSWNSTEHGDKIFATSDYTGDDSEKLQLEYEIKLMKEEIVKTTGEIENILVEEISMEKVKAAKNEIEIIEGKVLGYKEKKEALIKRNDEITGEPLTNELSTLGTNIEKLSGKIKEKKESIITSTRDKAEETLEMKYIEIAKEAVKMIEDHTLKAGIEALGVAILAVEKLEKTKLEKDIDPSYILVVSIKDYFSNAFNILESRIYIVINEINATKAVEKAEESLKHIDIVDAETAINLVTNDSVKTQLENRIQNINDAISAIVKVNYLKNKIVNILEEVELSIAIPEVEADLEKTQIEVDKIKDPNVRTIQQNIINEIKIAIAAMKAVDNAEMEPLKATNVTTARKAIDKLSIEYTEFGLILIDRLNDIDKKIAAQDVEKLVIRAENSLRMSDYTKTVDAIDKLGDSSYKDDLNNRAIDVLAIINAKEAIENAEKLFKSNKSTSEEYESEVNIAKENYNASKDKDKYKGILVDYNERISDMENTISAIKKVKHTEDMYNLYLSESTVDQMNTVTSNIGDSKALISKINDNNSNLKNIKKSLNSQIEGYSNKLSADGEYARINGNLLEIEKNMLVKNEGKYDYYILSEEGIEFVENKLKDIEDDSKVVKDRNLSTQLKNRITAIKNVIDATKLTAEAELVVEADIKKLIAKSIKAANTAIEKIKTFGTDVKIVGIDDYKIDLKDRVEYLEDKVEALTNQEKARLLVEKAIKSEKENDIIAAIDSVAKLRKYEENTVKEDLNKKISDEIIVNLIDNTNILIRTTISNIELNNKLASKNATEVKKVISLINNIVAFADISLDKIFKLEEGIEFIGYKDKYSEDLTQLNKDNNNIDLSIKALGAVQQAEKTNNQVDVASAKIAIKQILPVKIDGSYPEEDSEYSKYIEMKVNLLARVNVIQDTLDSEEEIEGGAEVAVKKVEDKLKVDTKVLKEPEEPGEPVELEETGEIIINNPSGEDLRLAQNAVDLVKDKSIKAAFQKRIDAIYVAMRAKETVRMAELFTDGTSIKAAEKALNDLIKMNSVLESCLEIRIDLKTRIEELNKQEDISKQVTAATNLIFKAISSRKREDIYRARFAVDNLKTLDEPSYNRLDKMLGDLEESTGNEAEYEKKARADAERALDGKVREVGEDGEVVEVGEVGVFDQMKAINIKINEIKQGDLGITNIEAAYKMIVEAENKIIEATAAVKRLSNQKEFAPRIDNANDILNLLKDNLHVKEAMRLINIALNSVSKPEINKLEVESNIFNANIAIDNIKRNENKDQKTTLIKAKNEIESKLTSDNDKRLIESAGAAIKDVVDIFYQAVEDDNIKEKQGELDTAIFSANMTIVLISNKNKDTKDNLANFLKDIETMYRGELAGIDVEEQIKIAEAAVEKAEASKLASDIGLARISIKMIKSDKTPKTELAINLLNARLDVLEGNIPGGSTDKPGSSKPGTSKPGGESSINKIPTTPYPSSDRFTGVTQPKWGETKELKKKSPTIKLPKRR